MSRTSRYARHPPSRSERANAIAARQSSSWRAGSKRSASPALSPKPRWSNTSAAMPASAKRSANDPRRSRRVPDRPCAITINGVALTGLAARPCTARPHSSQRPSRSVGPHELVVMHYKRRAAPKREVAGRCAPSRLRAGWLAVHAGVPARAPHYGDGRPDAWHTRAHAHLGRRRRADGRRRRPRRRSCGAAATSRSRTARSRRRARRLGVGQPRRRRATSPRAAPSRRSSAAGRAPAPRSPPTRSRGARGAVPRRGDRRRRAALERRQRARAEPAQRPPTARARGDPRRVVRGRAERGRRGSRQRRAPREIEGAAGETSDSSRVVRPQAAAKRTTPSFSRSTTRPSASSRSTWPSTSESVR